MADPKSDGRMITKDISDSDSFASLSDNAQVLFCMLIPHYSGYGKMNGGPGYIKDVVCPKIDRLTYENIPSLLSEIDKKTNVKWFECNGRLWIHSVKFLSDHQKLDEKRLGRDLLPTYSGLSPEKVRPEVEVEVEVEVEGEGEVGSPSGLVYEPDVDNLNALSQGVFARVVELYPPAGKQTGLADGQAARVFADEIPVSEHGPVVIAVRNYAAEVVAEGTAPQFVKRLVNFLRDGFWRNYLVRSVTGLSPPGFVPDLAWEKSLEEDVGKSGKPRFGAKLQEVPDGTGKETRSEVGVGYQDDGVHAPGQEGLAAGDPRLRGKGEAGDPGQAAEKGEEGAGRAGAAG